MKKRAFILAMITFIAAATSEPSINMVRAEETQTEENTGLTSELPIKTLTQKVIDENPYMAASDSNIHHELPVHQATEPLHVHKNRKR